MHIIGWTRATNACRGRLCGVGARYGMNLSLGCGLRHRSYGLVHWEIGGDIFRLLAGNTMGLSWQLIEAGVFVALMANIWQTDAGRTARKVVTRSTARS